MLLLVSCMNGCKRVEHLQDVKPRLKCCFLFLFFASLDDFRNRRGATSLASTISHKSFLFQIIFTLNQNIKKFSPFNLMHTLSFHHGHFIFVVYKCTKELQVLKWGFTTQHNENFSSFGFKVLISISHSNHVYLKLQHSFEVSYLNHAQIKTLSQ